MAATNETILAAVMESRDEQRAAMDQVWSELRGQDGRLRTIENRGEPHCEDHEKRIGAAEMKLATSSGRSSLLDKLLLVGGGAAATVLATASLELLRKMIGS